jgi:hypothetical protein
MTDNLSQKKQPDMQNYKGNHFNDLHAVKYVCPKTGAHFPFKIMCVKLLELR